MTSQERACNCADDDGPMGGWQGAAHGPCPVHDVSPVEQELRETLKTILAGFEKGVFVRSTEGDHDPTWGLKLVPYMRALAKANELTK